MFKINKIKFRKKSFEITSRTKNKFIYFTGDNASGKSTLLLDIASAFRVNPVRKYDENPNIFDTEIDVTGKPNKTIFYSMTPFCKFESKQGMKLIQTEGSERIGNSIGSSRYALLFQAVVEFCRSDTKKYKLFNEISEITNMSIEFRVRLQVDRIRAKMYLERHLKAVDSRSDLTTTILNNPGSFGLLLKPGHLEYIPYKFDNLYTNLENDISYFNSNSEELVKSLLFLRKIGALRIIKIETKKGEEWIASDNLSSGQLSLFVGLIILSSSIEDNSLILIDEPEVSLHPAWQRKYCELIYKISKYHKGCYFFVATHSPILISSIDPKQSIIINLGNEVEGFESEEAIGSKNIEEVLAIYFDLLTPNSYMVKENILRAVEALSDKNSSRFNFYKAVLQNIKKRIKDGPTEEIIDQILLRKIQ